MRITGILNRGQRVVLWATALALVTGGMCRAARLREAVTTAATGSRDWGLRFSDEGQPPVGNASAEELAAYGAYYVAPTEEKIIYLTFDMGYENGYTETILETLAKHQAPAAFFLVGNYLTTQPELVKKLVEAGHVVGNHTWSHPDMGAITDPEAFAGELRQVEEAYTAITGQPLEKFYRPPQGKFSEQNLEQAREWGYTTVFWSLAYRDWVEEDQPSREEALSKLLPRIHPGAIVLLHPTSRTNAEILDELLTKYEEMGYRFGSLRELSPGADFWE